MPSKKTPPCRVYELRVTLLGIKPPIWRTFRVPADITLFRLHTVLQIIMGWTDSHLYQYEKNDIFYGRPEDFEDSERQALDDKKTRLEDVIQQIGDEIIYTYDFGDNWQHAITLENILPTNPAEARPVCLAGARNCPPEDVGGTAGYEQFLEAIFDPQHEEHQEMLEWIGERFQPEEFDVVQTNARLAGK